MKNIPINARVECADGFGGESTYVVINPTNQMVTYFVIESKFPDPVEYLVPVDYVAETSSDMIRLSCTKEELAKMEPFTETHFIKNERPNYEDTYYLPYAAPSAEPFYARVEEERIPPGQLAVHRGAQVEATDGHVGKVGEFVVDPDSGHITHMILQEGHFWGKKEMALPVSVIERTFQDTVFLKLDKQAVESLPAIPLRRHYDLDDETALELVLFTFTQTDQAGEALKILKQRHQDDAISLLNAAVLVKDEAGKTSVKETDDVSPSHGTLFGAITGGLVGLLGGPVGAVVGAAAGAATGRAAARRIDMGFSDKFLQTLQEDLQPGNSALVVLVESNRADKAIEALAQFEGQRVQRTLSETMVQHLLAGDEAKASDQPTEG